MAQGKTIGVRYNELISNQTAKDEEGQESAEEIKQRIKSGVNEIFRKGGNL